MVHIGATSEPGVKTSPEPLSAGTAASDFPSFKTVKEELLALQNLLQQPEGQTPVMSQDLKKKEFSLQIIIKPDVFIVKYTK